MRCFDCRWWGKDKNDTSDETGEFRYCRHPEWSPQGSNWTRVYDDFGAAEVLVHMSFGCIGFVKKDG